MTAITWNRPLLTRFKKAYSQAVSDHLVQFTFDGNTYVTDYAKYLIEYLEGKLK